MPAVRPEAMALVGVPDGGGVVLGAGEEEVSAAAGCCRRNASGCSWPFIRTRLLSAASGGPCAVVVAAAVPEVGKDLKVCRPRMDALEARSLDLAPCRYSSCFKIS